MAQADGRISNSTFHFEQLLELLNQSVLRLGQDGDQRFLVQLVQHGDDRQATNELGIRPNLIRSSGSVSCKTFAHRAPRHLWSTHRRQSRCRSLRTVADDLFQTIKRAAADEQDIAVSTWMNSWLGACARLAAESTPPCLPPA